MDERTDSTLSCLALNLAGLDHVLGERREARLVAQCHAHVGQTPHQEPLCATDLAMGPASAAKSKRQFGQLLACQM